MWRYYKQEDAKSDVMIRRYVKIKRCTEKKTKEVKTEIRRQIKLRKREDGCLIPFPRVDQTSEKREECHGFLQHSTWTKYETETKGKVVIDI